MLTKENTGYKTQTHIAKALQHCSEAICSALQRYNAIAMRLQPSRPQLDWATIVECSFIGEFDLLRHLLSQVLCSPWTIPAHRETTSKFYHYLRAKEEIDCLNIKVRRLQSFIADEGKDVSKAIRRLLVGQPGLANVLRDWWKKRSAVNAIHIDWIDKIKALPYFSGVCRSGKVLAPLPLSLLNDKNISNNQVTVNDLPDVFDPYCIPNILDEDKSEDVFNSIEEFLLRM